MSLEYALEKCPARVKLRDGTECVIRPMGRRDAAKLHKFFVLMPEEERVLTPVLSSRAALIQPA